MADEHLLRKIHSLSDLELAVLLSLVAKEHCLVSTPAPAVDELVEELRLISIKTFGLAPAVISCHPLTTLDDFATALLLPHSPQRPASPNRLARPHHDPPASYFPSHPGSGRRHHNHHHHPRAYQQQQQQQQHQQQQQPFSPLAPAHIANVVIAKNLDRAPKAVQIQALELLRTRRVFTRSAVQAAPRQFLFVAAVADPGPGHGRTGGGARGGLTPHLNDLLYLAHWHDPEDGFANLDGEPPPPPHQPGWDADADVDVDVEVDSASTTSSESVVKTHGSGPRSASLVFQADNDWDNGSGSGGGQPIITEADLSLLASLGARARVDVDVVRYRMNVVSFLRMHRAVAGGVTPAATKHLERLAGCLAPLHGLDYVTPSLVALAARKVYLHRVRLVSPAHERSMQWGSDLAAIEAILEGVGPAEVIEDVLGMVAAPV